jgi:hypothetical protein
MHIWLDVDTGRVASKEIFYRAARRGTLPGSGARSENRSTTLRSNGTYLSSLGDEPDCFVGASLCPGGNPLGGLANSIIREQARSHKGRHCDWIFHRKGA